MPSPITEENDPALLALAGCTLGGSDDFPYHFAPLQEGGERRQLVNQALYTNAAGAEPAKTAETVGDLFLLSNESSLGVSEEEQVFHLRHAHGELMSQERAARATLRDEQPRQLEDRVGRAQGIASGARLLSFPEGLALISALRLGAAADLPGRLQLNDLNALLLRAQWAHLEWAAGRMCDDEAINSERADLFRSRFATSDS